MLRLGDLLIQRDEVRRITGHGRGLVVVLPWRLAELPVVLDLADASDLHVSWHGRDDPLAGIPLRLRRWEYRRVSSERGWLRLVFEIVVASDRHEIGRTSHVTTGDVQ